MKKYVLFFFLIFIFFACDKDDKINPSSQVRLIVELDLEYLSDDNLKSVKAILSLEPDQPVLLSEQRTDLSGRPSQVVLVLNLDGEAARQVIGKTVYLEVEIEYGNNNKSASKEFKIYGGQQTVNFNLKLVKTAVVKVNGHFQYDQYNRVDSRLIEFLAMISKKKSPIRDPIAIDRIKYESDSFQTPASLTLELRVEGDLATEYIGQTLYLEARAYFRPLGMWTFYFELIKFTLEEGEQEFNFNFSH